MAKKKKKNKRPDKRMTINQAIRSVNTAYDNMEVMALNTAERALRETFGFGDVRIARFREAYLYRFGEEAAKYALEVSKQMRKGM